MSTSLVLAGGGSAGHTSPLIATAAELERLHPGVRLTAVGTARGLETTVVPAAGTTVVSRPRAVPTAVSRTPGSSRRSSCAVAISGDVCPAVPPPASTTEVVPVTRARVRPGCR